jgi:ABC-2 type transport system ATP-binding protein
LAVPVGTQVVGAPTLSFTYKGLGNSRAVFAQIVDNSTNLVLGQIVTLVPVTLDGKQHQVSIDLNDIVYTYGGAKPGSLTLQITSSATAYENSSIGVITISDVDVALPNRSA